LKAGIVAFLKVQTPAAPAPVAAVAVTPPAKMPAAQVAGSNGVGSRHPPATAVPAPKYRMPEVANIHPFAAATSKGCVRAEYTFTSFSRPVFGGAPEDGGQRGFGWLLFGAAPKELLGAGCEGNKGT